MAFKLSFQFLRRACMARNSLIPKYPVSCLAVNQPERGLKKANYIIDSTLISRGLSTVVPPTSQFGKDDGIVPKECEKEGDESVYADPMFSRTVLYDDRSVTAFEFPQGKFSELLIFKKEKFPKGEDKVEFDPDVLWSDFTYVDADYVQETISYIDVKFSKIEMDMRNIDDFSNEQVEAAIPEKKGDESVDADPMFERTVLYDDRSVTAFEFPGGKFSELLKFKKEKFPKGEDEVEFDPKVLSSAYRYVAFSGKEWSCPFESQKFSEIEEEVRNIDDFTNEQVKATIPEKKGDGSVDADPMFERTVLYDDRSATVFEFPGGKFSELLKFKKNKFPKGEEKVEFDPDVLWSAYTYVDTDGVQVGHSFRGDKFSEIEKEVRDIDDFTNKQVESVDADPMFERTVLYDDRSVTAFEFPGGKFSELLKFKKDKFPKGEDKVEFDPDVLPSAYTHVATSGNESRRPFKIRKFSELEEEVRDIKDYEEARRNKILQKYLMELRRH